MIRATVSLFALASLAAAQAPIAIAPLTARPAHDKVTVEPSRAIDLVICLDVSGSMQGLINAARQNLWAVVNDMATLKPTPDLRVALLTYGCPAYGQETGFVAVQTGLTNDLDLVSQKLFALSTDGGDEYVARVVRRALDELSWSPDPMALKLIFVAGNEPATQDPMLDAMAESKAAITRSIIVNTIYCGDPRKAEADGWRQVAQLADGKFAAIEQDQAVVIETPFDKQLGELSASLNTTYVPYGKDAAGWVANQAAQDSNALNLNIANVAQRCQTKASVLYCNSQWDLVDAYKDPKFELAKVKKEDLSDELQKLTPEQLKTHVEKMAKQRAAIQAQVAEIGKQRDAFVEAEQKKLGENGDKLFEKVVLESVRAQAKARGFERKVEPKEVPAGEPAKKPGDSVDPAFAPIIEKAVDGYQQFVRVTGEPHMAPTDCRMPGPFALTSKATKQHGGKLYLLYARLANGKDYVEAGKPAEVGQTLVKEAWLRVEGQQQGPTEASKRYPLGLSHKDGNYEYHAGDAYGLFVMHKLAPDTAGTDQGWVYGTIDKHGKVTGAGRMASCIKCHQDADNDRRFGLE